MNNLLLDNMKTVKAKPILKWAGGKTQLIPQIECYLPQKLKSREINRYIEPFVGGGAVFFNLINKYYLSDAILIDNNPELIILYHVIKQDVFALLDELEKIYNKYITASNKKDYYYKIRNEYNSFDKTILVSKIKIKEFIRRAALTIFLNKTCFNGLYRVNKNGKFNVPMGDYINPQIFDKEMLINVSAAFQKAIIIHGDFESAKQYITPNSFIYYDPPYRPVSKTSAFISYTSHDFDDQSQKRVKNFFDEAHSKGALQMLSNSDPTNYSDDLFFDELYKDYNIYRIYAKRYIRTKGTQNIRELLITNYKK